LSCVFQSHAGSIEAGFSDRVPDGLEAFQSHAGSIEALSSLIGSPGVNGFQSHAGSIEACGSTTMEWWGWSVSIPRWFD